ncbi:tumor necrosis factor alpha-induced protein 8-like protein 1 [Lethenteron reissneri]|uniref:tumor necrosis factor alpha-induced protein 8-like protein 1 n=1 Tax=Lethenteron reissneri TaxID=7753 RepID=UPI002AB7297F|nr:tumor necrosis factor alpha-induced protein 8-like protein 1 [Lethenteron reissneri]
MDTGLLLLDSADEPLDGFSARHLVLRVQSKLQGKCGGGSGGRGGPPSPSSAPPLVDETAAAALDALYRVARDTSGSQKRAQRLLKDLVKLMVTVGLLSRSGRLAETPEAAAEVQRLKGHVRRAAMTALSFYQVDFTFEREVLAALLAPCAASLGALLPAGHGGRVARAFRALAAPELLAALYDPSGAHRRGLAKMCEAIDGLLDRGIL